MAQKKTKPRAKQDKTESFRAAIRRLLIANRRAHKSDDQLAALVTKATGGKRDGSPYTAVDVRRARSRYNRLEAKPTQRVPKYENGKAVSISTRKAKKK